MPGRLHDGLGRGAARTIVSRAPLARTPSRRGGRACRGAEAARAASRDSVCTSSMFSGVQLGAMGSTEQASEISSVQCSDWAARVLVKDVVDFQPGQVGGWAAPAAAPGGTQPAKPARTPPCSQGQRPCRRTSCDKPPSTAYLATPWCCSTEPMKGHLCSGGAGNRPCKLRPHWSGPDPPRAPPIPLPLSFAPPQAGRRWPASCPERQGSQWCQRSCW